MTFRSGLRWFQQVCFWAALSAAAPLASTSNAQTAKPQTPSDPAKPESVMTKQQAKELFESVDKIMAFAADDSGLPAVVKVKRRLVTRDEVNRYLVKNFDEDESSKRLQRSEIVLKKFGMLSRDFELRPFLLSLLTEQIAGYYDEKSKTVNLLNWIPPEDQKPVLAHELTHALQDQKVDLEKWSNNGFTGVSRKSSEDTQRIFVDEQETARQAVTEGQAMVVFVDYSLSGSGKTLATSPGLASKMKDGSAEESGSSLMARAPLLLQRSLEFPYMDGLVFEQALLVKGGKKLAFSSTLENPPSSSFEIMNPEAYLAHVAVPVLRMPDVHDLLDADYEPYDLGVMGELDVEMMASLFGGAEVATELAPAWNGGVYYAAQRRSATPAEKLTTGSLGILYFSRWKSEDAAKAFAKIYTAELGRKYSGLVERKQDETADGEQVYTTHEGDVLLSLSPEGLFISEGLPLDKMRLLREKIIAVQSSGPMKMAAEPAHELLFGDTVSLEHLGVVHAALRLR